MFALYLIICLGEQYDKSKYTDNSKQNAGQFLTPRKNCFLLQVTSFIILSFRFALARKSDNETACSETKIDEARKSDNETACSETTNDRTEKQETSGFREPLSSKKTTGKILRILFYHAVNYRD